MANIISARTNDNPRKKYPQPSREPVKFYAERGILNAIQRGNRPMRIPVSINGYDPHMVTLGSMNEAPEEVAQVIEDGYSKAAVRDFGTHDPQRGWPGRNINEAPLTREEMFGDYRIVRDKPSTLASGKKED